MGIPRFWADNIPPVQTLEVGSQGGIIPSTGIVNSHVNANAGIAGSKLAAEARVRTAQSIVFDLDNGAGTTVDDVILVPMRAITITAAQIIYVEATQTVAGGNAKIGTTVGGSGIASATAYQNTKAVGTVTSMTISNGAVAAGTPVCVRHTGVAATQTGRAKIEIEYVVDDAA